MPSDEEWTELIIFLDEDASPDAWGWQSYSAGGMLKDAGTLDTGDGLWHSPNEGVTNASGFMELPEGYRSDFNGYNYSKGTAEYFWSSTENEINSAYYRHLVYSSPNAYRNSLYKN